MSKPVRSSILSLLLIFFCFSLSSAQIDDFSHIGFTKADSIAALYPNHSLKDLRFLSDKLTKPLSTDVEKFRAIYRWVCDNIKNDYGGYKKNKYKREKLIDQPEELKEWELKFSSTSFQRLINRQETVCTGYAYLIRELSYFAGISCEIIHGYGRNSESNIGGQGIPNHSWNAVQLNNKWYLCDPTWSSGAIHLKEVKFIQHFNEEYFLAKPSLFVMNHYPIDPTWVLEENKPTLDKFLNGPLIYKRAYHYDTKPVFPETFEIIVSRGESISFLFESNSFIDLQNLKMQIVSGGHHSIAKNDVIQVNQKEYKWDYTFDQKGQYVVHIMMSEEYLFSYSVKVEK